MPPGRPAAKPRTILGEHIALARKEKGMTQAQLAESLGVTQRVITYWEREPVALKPEQLASLADALDSSADFLIGRVKPTKRGSGPKGKARKLFDELAALPRAKQQRVLSTIDDMILAQKAKAS